MKRSIIAAFSGVLASLALAISPTSALDVPQEIVVGAVLPLTGEESRVGTYFKAAYELATKEINDAGGLVLRDYHKRIPLRLIIYDDKTDPATSRNLYERLATQDHVDSFLGGYSTELIQAHTVVAQQHQIPYVNGGGASTEIYHRGYSTIFGILSSIQNLALTECAFIEKQQADGKLPKPLVMAVIYENTSHGRDFVDGLNKCAKDKPENYKIALNEAFDLHGRDFTPLLQKVKAAGADAFMSDAHLDDYITMQRQYKQLGLKHKFITYGARGPEKSARDALGDAVDYIVAASWWNNKIPNGPTRAFVAKWKKAYPQLAAEWFSALPYETARTLYIAMTDAGSADKAKVVAALRKIDIVDTIIPGGHIRFTADGQSAAPFVVTQNRPGGIVEVVWPRDVATGTPTLPVP